MKKYSVLGSKNGNSWSSILDGTTSKASATRVAKEWELSGGSAEIWVIENKNGAQITYKVK